MTSRLQKIIGLIFLAATFEQAAAENITFSKLDGFQITSYMEKFGDKCPPPANNRSWAPITENITCAETPRCNFPQQWCSYKLSSDGTPDLGTLSCKPLAASCVKAFQDAKAAGTLEQTPSTPPTLGGAEEGGGGDNETNPIPNRMLNSTSTANNNESNSMPNPAEAVTPPASLPPPAPGKCCDYHEYCCFWASLGQCDSNKLFMAQICQTSCGTCGCKRENLDTCKINVSPACNGGITNNPVCPCKESDLVHRDWHENCTSWAEKGYCEKNAQFMKPMCKKSCNICV